VPSAMLSREPILWRRAGAGHLVRVLECGGKVDVGALDAAFRNMLAPSVNLADQGGIAPILWTPAVDLEEKKACPRNRRARRRRKPPGRGGTGTATWRNFGERRCGCWTAMREMRRSVDIAEVWPRS